MEHVLALLRFLQENNIELEQFMAGGQEVECLPGCPDTEGAWELIRFMDEMPGGFLIYRAGGGEEILYANRALLRIFGCETMGQFREVTRNSFRGLVHPDDLDAVEESIREQIAHSHYDLDYVEYRITRRDGAVRWIEDYGHFVRTRTAGDIFYVFLGDATEKIRRQQMAQASLLSEKERQVQKIIDEYDEKLTLINQEQLRRLEVIEGLSVNYESILYADLDEDTIVPYRLSMRTERQFGEKYQSRPLGWYVRDYVETWVHPEDKAEVARTTDPDYMRRELAENVTYYLNYRAVVNGETQYLQLRIVNVGRGEGVSQAVLGYRRMDKELLEEQEQKRLLAEALQNANLAILAKNAFLSNMSHDMRTPLNAIFGFTTLARRHLQESEVLLGYLDKVEDASGNLLDLIDKVLEISWLESRESCLEEAPCDLADIIEEVYGMLRSKAGAKNIDFTLDCDGLVHREVLSDRRSLRQVALHLTSNAITYTNPGGRVSLTLSEGEYRPDGRAVYRLEVKDNGVGISESFLRHMFEPFQREKNTTSSGVHGTGLGLTIAKNIVDTLEGTIEVESAPNRGSTFTVTVCLHVQPEQTAPVHVESAGLTPGQRVLVVEDNEINLEIEAAILKDQGFLIDTAADGDIAVEKIARSGPGDYDLVLMDIQMPTMDGWQATMAIRSLPDPALAHIPVIALSANALEGDIRTSMECGMDAHLPKPIDVPLLLKTIGEVLEKHRASQQSGQP